MCPTKQPRMGDLCPVSHSSQLHASSIVHCSFRHGPTTFLRSTKTNLIHPRILCMTCLRQNSTIHNQTTLNSNQPLPPLLQTLTTILHKTVEMWKLRSKSSRCRSKSRMSERQCPKSNVTLQQSATIQNLSPDKHRQRMQLHCH